MHITVINESAWPTPALKVISQWVVGEMGITWPYRIIFANKRNGWWSGQGWIRRSIIRIHRRLTPSKWPYTYRDRRFGWAPEITLNNRIEALVNLIAHEMAHAIPGGRGQDGRRSKIEYFAIDKSKQILQKFRVVWPELRTKIWSAMRLEHVRSRKRALKAREAKRPENRALKGLEMAEKSLRQWRRKLKLAETKVKGYVKKVSYYNRKKEQLWEQLFCKTLINQNGLS